MNDSRYTGGKVLVGFLLTLAASAPALAAPPDNSYVVGLFQGGTGTGSGSFTFANNGNSGLASVTLSTNLSSAAGARNFIAADLNVEVAAVDFNDGKTAEKYGANQITGKYVEGLTGSLQTASFPCGEQSCYYRITLAFAPNSNPNAALKTYTIELIEGDEATDVTSGTYSVSNIETIPEPGSLALLGIGFAALAWGAMKRRPRGAAV